MTHIIYDVVDKLRHKHLFHRWAHFGKYSCEWRKSSVPDSPDVIATDHTSQKTNSAAVLKTDKGSGQRLRVKCDINFQAV